MHKAGLSHLSTQSYKHKYEGKYMRKILRRKPTTHTRKSFGQKEKRGSGGEKERTHNFITEGLRFEAVACSYNLTLLIDMQNNSNIPDHHSNDDMRNVVQIHDEQRSIQMAISHRDTKPHYVDKHCDHRQWK